jgi:hypothetical protein
MKKQRVLSEKGQSLVIVALGLVAFVAMLALVIDGANAYAAKRQAQNAADAGALAGAQYMCSHINTDGNLYNNTVDTANHYATDLNDADFPADVDVNISSATVVVTATVTRDTFFAGVIGYPFVSPVAVAEAACKNPGVGVLPVAWSCRANAQEGVITPGEECEMKINYDPENDPNPYNPDNLYILMDSVKVKKDKLNDPACKVEDPPLDCLMDTSDIICYDEYPSDTPPCTVPSDYVGEKIDCDINDDCIDELKTGGARAWLDLEGGNGGGASDLINWIENPESVPEVNVHDWLPSIVSVSTSVFKAAIDLVGTDVVLPVFNNMCTTGAPDILYTLSQEEIDDGYEPQQFCTYTQLDNTDKTGSSVNYHIYAFTAFHVTCVQTGKNKNNQVFPEDPAAANNPKGWCNGHYAAATNCVGTPPHETCSIDENDKTIEGYFTVLDLGGYGGPGAWNNLGTFTVVLVR